MTEVLYWTVVEIKPPVLDQLELFFLNQSHSFVFIFASSVFGFSADFILVENKLIKMT